MLRNIKRLIVLAIVFGTAAGSFPAQADASLTGWRKGINIQPSNNGDYSSANFQQSMRNATADGVNHVTLVMPLRQSNIYSSDVYVPDYTRPINRLETVLNLFIVWVCRCRLACTLIQMTASGGPR